MNEFSKKKREAILKKHEEAMALMLKGNSAPWPVCLSFFAAASVALAEASVIACSTENQS